MPTQAELIDGVVRTLQLPSDYALGKLWGIPMQTMSGYRKERRPFDAYMCTRVAEALNKDPREIQALVELKKAPSGERRRYWEDLLRKRYGAASVGACIIALAAWSMLTAPIPSNAYSLGIMSNRRPRKTAYKRFYERRWYLTLSRFGRLGLRPKPVTGCRISQLPRPLAQPAP